MKTEIGLEIERQGGMLGSSPRGTEKGPGGRAASLSVGSALSRAGGLQSVRGRRTQLTLSQCGTYKRRDTSYTVRRC